MTGDVDRGRMSPHHISPATRTACRVALPALAVIGALAASSPAGARPSAVTCGAVVTSDVRLTADLLDCPASGIVVGAPAITIDLAGHVVDGTGSGAGIDNEAGHDDVRITRGTLREFVFGVILVQADGTKVDRVVAAANLDGFKIAGSVDVELDRVSADGNAGGGIGAPDGTIDGGGKQGRGNTGADCTGVVCR